MSAAALITWGIAVGAAGCVSCPTALLDGVLVADGASALAIKETTSGFVREISWPSGYEVRPGQNRLLVTDFLGRVIAEEGDHVQLQGGEKWSDGPWGVCGQISVVEGDVVPEG